MNKARKIISVIVTVCILFYASAQKNYVIYEVGRPNTLEFNNAKRIIGNQYGINFIYVGQQMLDSIGVDEIERKNNVSKRLIATKKSNDKWEREFYEKIINELEEHQSMRVVLKNTELYKRIKNREIHIVFDRKKHIKNKFSVYVIGQHLLENKYVFRSFLMLKMNSRTKKIKVKDTETRELHFSYEENGVI